MKEIQQTLILIKPDALLYSLTGFIIERISAVLNPVIAGAKVVRVTKDLAEAHYTNIRGKPYFDITIKYIMGELHYPNQPEKRRVMAVTYEAPHIVDRVKQYLGPTNPKDCKRLAKEKGVITLRSQLSYTDYTVEHGELIDNAVHASENPKEAEREIKLWFEPGDFPKQHRFFPYTESKEHFYYSPDPSSTCGFKILNQYAEGSKCIIGPGCLVWESDYHDICAFFENDLDSCKRIVNVIAKYTLKSI
jgi:nucleoside-diphosphate kinase